MQVQIALVGNPNSGKTTLYNSLTGSVQYVGNWPGVTVEKKMAEYKKDRDLMIVDLPGIYSLSPYSMEEVVSRNFLLQDDVDIILNVVDASNLERNLYLTTQLLETGIPVIVALNMMDIVKKKGDHIDIKELERFLGCKIVEISALKNNNIDFLMNEVKNLSKLKKKQDNMMTFNQDIENLITNLTTNVAGIKNSKNPRWEAIKAFENDEIALQNLNLSSEEKESLDRIRRIIEEKYDDDSQSIIINERYNYITDSLKTAYKKINRHTGTSYKIDRIVTNRILALPIFLVIMWAVYYISMGWLGSMGSDYLNDVIFGQIVPDAATSFLESLNVNEYIISLIIDGIIAGVGGVLGFTPLIIVLYFLLSILEDCGYMARIAFIMDRIFRKFGLSGKSFISILVGTGCSVPGLMATRTIEDDKDRKMTLIVTSFMPCGAKAPIIALIAAIAFGGAAWVAPLTYLLGLVAIIVSGIILKKTKLFAGDPAPFVMELPEYHIPTARNVLLHTWERTKSFITKAGTVIMASSIVMWLMMSLDTSFNLIAFQESGSESILAALGNIVSPIFKSTGFGTWQAAVAVVTGLIAKENVISTLGIMTGFGEVDPEAFNTVSGFVAYQHNIFDGYIGAFSFMLFNLFCIPCFAAVGAIRREMNSAKWTAIAIGYQMVFAYVVSFIVYQVGRVIFYGVAINVYTIIAIVLIIISMYLLFRPYTKKEKLYFNSQIAKSKML